MTTCRLATQAGLLPIPWSAIVLWCDEHEVFGITREDVFYHVRALDMAYLEHMAAKMGS